MSLLVILLLAQFDYDAQGFLTATSATKLPPPRALVCGEP